MLQRLARIHEGTWAGSAFAAACASTVFNFITTNYSQISSGAYGSPVPLYLMVTAITALGLGGAVVLSKITRQPVSRYLAVMTLGIFFLFLSGEVRSILKGLFRDFGLTRGSASVTVLILIGLIGTTWLLSRHLAVRKAINVFAIFAMVVSILNLFMSLSQAGGRTTMVITKAAVTDTPAQFTGENVYYIIVDEYAGPDGTRLLGYDNSRFFDKMRGHGFVLNQDSRSNYVATFLSLAAILEADYPATEQTPPFVDRSNFYPARINAEQEPDALRQFREAQYRRVRISNDWGGCGGKAFQMCFGTSATANTYLLQTYLSAAMVNPAWLYTTNSKPNNALELLAQHVSGIMKEGPFFLFAHHFSPHAPYDRTSDCQYRDAEGDASRPREEKTELYLAALQCVNLRLEKTVEKLIAVDPKAIIVIQSDHGSDFNVNWASGAANWSQSGIRERTSILNLVRLPERCSTWNRSDLGQVNTMRLVLGCLRDEPPKFLPESIYISSMERTFDYGMVRKVPADFNRN